MSYFRWNFDPETSAFRSEVVIEITYKLQYQTPCIHKVMNPFLDPKFNQDSRAYMLVLEVVFFVENKCDSYFFYQTSHILYVLSLVLERSI